MGGGGTVFIKGGLASVVVLCDGPPLRTRRCIEALLRQTRRPWELIAVVDEGGENAAYLSGIRDAATVHVEIVPAPQDPAAFRHAPGIAAACGDYLALIDDGTIVSLGWLERLASLADWDPNIALAAPMIGDATPPQRAEGPGSLDPDSVGEFAERWTTEHRRQWFATDRLAPSCIVVRRSVYESLAETPVASVDDLAARALGRGLMLAINRELFVHHSTHVPEPSTARPGPHLLMPKGGLNDLAPPAACPRRLESNGPRPRVSLTMIVRDEEANIGPCLESAAGLCDEMIVVDTGSTDRTAEIARSLGAKVVPFTWVDDFAAARNAALDHATGRYAFWLDADDRIDDVNRGRLRDLNARLDDGEEAAHVMQQLSTGGDGRYPAMAADHVRLFPIRDDVRWSYRVHEQILPSIIAAGVPVRWTDIVIGHVGYSDSITCERKLDRNLRILGAELREKPSDALVLFNIGWAALYRREARTALGYLRASLASITPRDVLVRKTYALLAQAYQMLGDADAALATCVAGHMVAPDDAGILFSMALLRQERGDLAGAEACWRKILVSGQTRKFSITSPGIGSHLTRRKLAALVERRGDIPEALRLWTEVLDECPGDPEASRAQFRLSLPSHAVVVSAG
jgi:glycosyltransferase involved in cell wall biosynthesis